MECVNVPKEREKEKKKKTLLSFLKNPITFLLRLVIFCVVQHRSTRKGFCKYRLGLCFVLRAGAYKDKSTNNVRYSQHTESR